VFLSSSIHTGSLLNEWEFELNAVYYRTKESS
jgi:hypothetical protein